MSTDQQNQPVFSGAEAAAMIKRRVLETYGLTAPEIPVMRGHSNGFPLLFLEAGLEVIEIGPFDRNRLLQEGMAYLRECYGTDADTFYSEDTVAELTRNTIQYLDYVQSVGSQYNFTLSADTNQATLAQVLSEGYMAVVFAPQSSRFSMPYLVRSLGSNTTEVGLYPDPVDERIYTSLQDLSAGIDLTHGLFGVRPARPQ